MLAPTNHYLSIGNNQEKMSGKKQLLAYIYNSDGDTVTTCELVAHMFVQHLQ